MKIRVLHLSDFHFKSGNSNTTEDQARTSRAIIAKIQAIPDNEKPDIIAITGDIAHSAKKREYDAASLLIERLIEAAKIERERIFIVAGNHDVDTTKIESIHTKHWYRYTSGDEINEILSNRDYNNILNRKFRQFNSFAARTAPGSKCNNTSFSYAHDIEIRKTEISQEATEPEEIRVRVSGINSAVFYHSNSDHNLAIGTHQVDTTIDPNKEIDLTISLIHHPRDWLHGGDKKNYDYLEMNSDIILHGHTHERTHKTTNNGDYTIATISPGACHKGNELNKEFCIIEIETGIASRIRIQYYKFRPEQLRISTSRDIDIIGHDKEKVLDFKKIAKREETPTPTGQDNTTPNETNYTNRREPEPEPEPIAETETETETKKIEHDIDNSNISSAIKRIKSNLSSILEENSGIPTRLIDIATSILESHEKSEYHLNNDEKVFVLEILGRAYRQSGNSKEAKTCNEGIEEILRSQHQSDQDRNP